MSSGGANAISSLVAGRLSLFNHAFFAQAVGGLTSSITGSDLTAAASRRSVLATLEGVSGALTNTAQRAGTAHAALGEVADLLGEAQTLAQTNADGSNLSAQEKQENQDRIDTILLQIDGLAGSTSTGNQSLLDGSATLSVAGGGSVALSNLATTELGEVRVDGTRYRLADIGSGGALDTQSGDAAGAVQAIGAARDQVDALRTKISRFQNDTVSVRQSRIDVAIENTAAAEGGIRAVHAALNVARHLRTSVLGRFPTVRFRSSSSDVLALIG